MLAGDADRERAADVLKAAYAEGRLNKGEYDHRLARSLAVRTVEELQRLTLDLPNGPGALPPGYPCPGAPAPVPYRGAAPIPYGYPALPEPPQNSSATTALICGIAAPFSCAVTALPAVIYGHKARAEIRRTGERGEGAAVTGLVLGWIVLTGVVFVFLGVLL